MKSFRQFITEMVANVAGGAGLAMYDPFLSPKLFRRKRRKS